MIVVSQKHRFPSAIDDGDVLLDDTVGSDDDGRCVGAYGRSGVNDDAGSDGDVSVQNRVLRDERRWID